MVSKKSDVIDGFVSLGCKCYPYKGCMIVQDGFDPRWAVYKHGCRISDGYPFNSAGDAEEYVNKMREGE